MTDIKQLPENLKELELTAAFKGVYKKYTVEQLQELLIEAGTDYLSNDNKAALVWRYMDASGMSFDDPISNTINDMPEPVVEAEPAAPTTEEIIDYAGSTQKTPESDVSNDGNGDDYQERSTDAKTTSAAATDEVKDSEPVDTQTQETTDHAQTETPVPADGNSLPTIDSRGEEQPSTSGDNNTAKQDAKTAAPVDVKAEREFVEVTNNGAYNFYETATGTMVTARQATKIYPTATIDKAHILRNIKQYNQTRGNILKITD